MTKKTETETEPVAPHGETRKCRYIGASGRGFDSVPFGVRLVFHTGNIYDVPVNGFSYLWTDPQFEAMFEWLEGSAPKP